MLKKEEDGSLKVDYGMHKKKYRTQYQLDDDERRRKLEELRGNADLLREEKAEQRRGEKHSKREE